jgi:hypothetical protein
MKNVEDVHSYSKAVPQLTMGYSGTDLSIASGLVFGAGHRTYLITAAHNLTGREPDGKPKHSQGALPNELRLEGYHIRANLRLYSGTNEPHEEDQRLYAVSKERDIAIIKVDLSKAKGDRVFYPLDESFLDPKVHSVLKIGIGDNCFVVGYPTGMHTATPDGPTPIWKAATIASEPRYTGPDQPLLIDTWGERGLSGGPVFSEKTVGHTELHRLIGIYSGRMFTQCHQGEKEQSLGTVTPTELVMELFKESRDTLDATKTRL